MKSYYMENTDRGFRITMDDREYGETGLHEEIIGISCVAFFIVFLVIITII